MTFGEVVRAGAARLAEAGVASPRADAELLAAHVLHLSRSEVSHLALVGGAGPRGLSGGVRRPGR